MAVGLIVRFDGGTEDQYRAVHSHTLVDQNPPDGLIFHSAGPTEGAGGSSTSGSHVRRLTGSWSQDLERPTRSSVTEASRPAPRSRSSRFTTSSSPSGRGWVAAGYWSFAPHRPDDEWSSMRPPLTSTSVPNGAHSSATRRTIHSSSRP